MKLMCLCLASTLMVLGACSSTTSTSERTGAALTIVEPADQSIRQGDTNKIMIAVTRDNFDAPVRIRFTGLPAGVSIGESDPTIPSGDNIKEFTLRADQDAAIVTNHYVRVTAIGQDGLETTEAFQLTVRERN
jgi:hypothetical protein